MSITLNRVSYTYTAGTAYESKALINIEVTIKTGEFVGIMGKTGCGKSTLIQLMDGLIPPTSGNVLLDGEDINSKHYKRTALRKKIGFVFQFPECQLFETTVEKDVAFGLKHSGLSKKEVEDAVKDAIEAVGFEYEKIRNRSPLSFSGGEKRRIAIAGVLATKPEILILDEPIAGLDPKNRIEFLHLLDRLNAEGVTIIMVSHNADVIAEHASRVIVLKDGRIAEDGSVADVFAKAAHKEDYGIGVCQIRQIAESLSERGRKIPNGVITYKQLLSCIEDMERRRNSGTTSDRVISTREFPST